MRRMNAGIEARAPLFDKDRIGPIGGMVLLTIAEIQPAPMQKVADRMARDKGQISRTISLLERREILVRRPNDEDSRSTLLELTDKGERMVAHIKGALDDVLSDILTPLDAGERNQLLRLLKQL